MNLRQEMIAAAMKEAGEPYTLDRLVPLLPKDFELIERDLIEQPITADFEVIEPTDKPAVVSLADLAPTEPAPIEPPAAKINPPADSIEQAEARVTAAENALANARAAVVRCQRAENASNGALAQAINDWQAGFPAYTPEQLRRDHLAAEQQLRADRAAGKLPPRRSTPGKSRIDQQRMWARGTGPDDGRGNSGRAIVDGRRVYPAHMKGARIPMPAKPPSVR